MKTDSLDKFIARSNFRKKMEFGVEQPIDYGDIKIRMGISNRRHYVIYNISVAKRMSKENLEILRLMKNPKLKGI